MGSIKKGDTVYIYSTDPRNSSEEHKIIGVGPKYITIDGATWMNKFRKDTLICEQWSTYSLFPGTKAEYEAYQKDRQKADECIKRINKMMSDLNYEQTKKVEEFINSLLK